MYKFIIFILELVNFLDFFFKYIMQEIFGMNNYLYLFV